ncbi:MAG: glycoside hydrolase family 16 protein [Tangfeifania sp.]
MKYSVFTLIVLLPLIFACNQGKKKQDNNVFKSGIIEDEPKSQDDWELVWSDEFNYTGLPDTTKWSYDVGGHGWGNNEKQYYTEADPDNAKVIDGVLEITARQEKKDDNLYTSARLVTKNKGDWKYGKVEVSAKLPPGRGLWPAIWMLPTDWEYGGWPDSGEIDIMEHVGYNPDSIFQTVHTKSFNHTLGTQVGEATYVEDVYNQFHTYSIIWDVAEIDFYIDGEKHFTFLNSGKGFDEWPFDKRFHLILNLAVGGNWGGQKGIDDSVFPATFTVDYVRVYKSNTE